MVHGELGGDPKEIQVKKMICDVRKDGQRTGGQTDVIVEIVM